VQIEAIEFSDFRNFHALSFAAAPSLNILTGPNAQGKTNLLEGLAVLLVGRSFRGAKAAEFPRWSSIQPAMMSGALRRGEVTRTLRRVIQPREDGVWTVSGEGCPWARAIAFAWQDMAILHGPPQARRDFIDGFAGKLYPAHLTAWRRYRQILGRRNRLLQNGLEASELRASLEPWNEQLVRVGCELLGRRRTAVDALALEVERLYPVFAGHGHVALQYRGSLGDDWSEDGFYRALERRFREEVQRGTTLVGPHRDDLIIELDGRDLRCFGSRGQQRLMALALRLAERGPVSEAVGSPPVLLLDDALSELDPKVRTQVLDHVGRAGQVFLTTADPDLGDSGRATWWDVREGRVSARGLTAVRGAA
jgi:DNA replication and repair protein RecF